DVGQLAGAHLCTPYAMQVSALTPALRGGLCAATQGSSTQYGHERQCASMTSCAVIGCTIADMNLKTPGSAVPNPDDLLVLLAVARTGLFTTAAETLGLNHTTVSRRIAALEKDLGGRTLARTVGGWELTDLGRKAV